MPEIQFEVNVARDVRLVWWMEIPVYRFRLTNQNHCYMLKLNDCTIILIQVIAEEVIFASRWPRKYLKIRFMQIKGPQQ